VGKVKVLMSAEPQK